MLYIVKRQYLFIKEKEDDSHNLFVFLCCANPSEPQKRMRRPTMYWEVLPNRRASKVELYLIGQQQRQRNTFLKEVSGFWQVDERLEGVGVGGLESQTSLIYRV